MNAGEPGSTYQPGDRYEPGEGFQSLIGNGQASRDVIRTTLIVGVFFALRETLGLYVGRQVALGIANLCLGALLIGLTTRTLLRSTPKEERGARLVFIAILIAGSVFVTLSIQSLFFAE